MMRRNGGGGGGGRGKRRFPCVLTLLVLVIAGTLVALHVRVAFSGAVRSEAQEEAVEEAVVVVTSEKKLLGTPPQSSFRQTSSADVLLKLRLKKELQSTEALKSRKIIAAQRFSSFEEKAPPLARLEQGSEHHSLESVTLTREKKQQGQRSGGKLWLERGSPEYYARMEARDERKRRKRPTGQPTPQPTPQPTKEALCCAVAFPFNRGNDRKVQNVEKTHRPSGWNYIFDFGAKHEVTSQSLFNLGMGKASSIVTGRWDVFIGAEFAEAVLKAAPSHAVISFFPGVEFALEGRVAIARLQTACADQEAGPEVCEFAMPTFVLKKGLLEGPAANRVEALGPATWRMVAERSTKKRRTEKNKYDKVLAATTAADTASNSSIAKWVKGLSRHHDADSTLVLQQYVQKPAVLARRKFELRVGVLILSVDPLIVYFLDVGFPRVASEDYRGWNLPEDAESLESRCMHEVDCEGASASGTTRDLSFLTELRFGRWNGLRTPTEEDAEKNWEQWQTEMWPSAEETVMAAIIIAKPFLVEREAAARKIWRSAHAGEADHHRRFSLLWADMTWDTQAHRWRLEQFLTNENTPESHVDAGYNAGWLHLAGVTSFPDHLLYEEKLEARLDDFCKTRQCAEDEKAFLRLAAHQQSHASGGWYRLHPPVAANKGRRRDPGYSRRHFGTKPTKNDELLAAWLTELDARHHAARAAREDPDHNANAGKLYTEFNFPSDFVI